MEIIKKMILFVTCLTIIAIFPLCSMDEPPRATQLAPWTLKAGDVILGKKSIQEFQKATKSKTELFTSLPKEKRKKIIKLLPMVPNAANLTSAGNTISLLTQTHHQLDQLINNAEFSLQLIQSLSAKFNIDNETVCQTIQTEEAQKLLTIQTTLKNLCGTHPNLKNFSNIYQQGADANFTYKKGKTLLLFCITNNELLLLRFLLKKGANPNHFVPGIGTPLTTSITFDNPEAVESLLEAGADPELEDGMGMTPLGAANFRGNDKIMKLLMTYLKKNMKTKK